MVKNILVVVLVASCVFAQAAGKKEVKKTVHKQYQVTLETSLGDIVCDLFADKAPKTVANFVDLAQGKKEWTDSRTGKKSKSLFYDGLSFHRVIPNFMIQGGDPLGNGTGGPGYQFEDEIDASLKFDRPGLLAMANSGPGTNGSQFFITVANTPWLSGHHTIFGQTKDAKSLELVTKIANVARDERDLPLTPVVIKKVTVRELSAATKQPTKSK